MAILCALLVPGPEAGNCKASVVLQAPKGGVETEGPPTPQPILAMCGRVQYIHAPLTSVTVPRMPTSASNRTGPLTVSALQWKREGMAGASASIWSTSLRGWRVSVCVWCECVGGWLEERGGMLEERGGMGGKLTREGLAGPEERRSELAKSVARSRGRPGPWRPCCGLTCSACRPA